MSSKNTLQEFFAKRCLPLPLYDSKFVGGEPHSPQFVSTVTLFDDSVFESDVFSKKKDAEKNAACKALLEWEKDAIPCARYVGSRTVESREFSFSKEVYVGIFIDLENKPNIALDLPNVLDNDELPMTAFASKGHPTLLKEYNTDRIDILEVPTTRSDGADIGMVLSIGFSLASEYPLTHYIIVTGDHFGDACVDCLRHFSDYNDNTKSKEACCCQSLDEIFRQLDHLEKEGKFKH